MDAYQTIFETLDLDATQPLPLSATIGLSPDDQRDTLRASLPLLDLSNSADAQFQISRVIGRGGMGVVHLATQPSLGREVAIKTVGKTERNRASELSLLQEARAMGVVEHPNVVPVHLIGQDENGRPIIVMKRIDGTPWDRFIDDPTCTPDDDPLGFHLNVFLGVCQAMSFAHSKGILHRDIKPENVMIGSFGEVYLLDWGLAVTLQGTLRTVPEAKSSHSVVGTPVYMAPEMTVGDGTKLGTHTDIFLLGATLFHAVTGDAPNLGGSLFEVMSFAYTGLPRVYPQPFSEELRAICERAMAKAPEDRFGTVEELRTAVQAFLTHRNSHELTESANKKFLELKTASHAEDLHTAFLEVRFGFMSALQIWHENHSAQAGLQKSISWMIRQELADHHLTAAKQLYSQLPNPDPKLESEIQALATQLGSEKARLDKIAFDYDESIGVTGRRGLVALMAAIFAASPFFIYAFEDMVVPKSLVWITADPLLLISGIIGLAFLPALLGMVAYTYKHFAEHKASRIFAKSMIIMYIMGIMARFTSITHDVPIYLAATAETAIYTVGLFVLGLAVDRRFGTPAFLYFFTTVALAFSKDAAIFTYSIGSVLACLGFLYSEKIARLRMAATQALGLNRATPEDPGGRPSA